jgi:hypothetical protein
MRTRLYLGIDFHIGAIFFRESSKLIKGVTVKVKEDTVCTQSQKSFFKFQPHCAVRKFKSNNFCTISNEHIRP